MFFKHPTCFVSFYCYISFPQNRDWDQTRKNLVYGLLTSHLFYSIFNLHKEEMGLDKEKYLMYIILTGYIYFISNIFFPEKMTGDWKKTTYMSFSFHSLLPQKRKRDWMKKIICPFKMTLVLFQISFPPKRKWDQTMESNVCPFNMILTEGSIGEVYRG